MQKTEHLATTAVAMRNDGAPSSVSGKNINQLGAMLKGLFETGELDLNRKLSRYEEIAAMRSWVFVAVRCIRDAVASVPLRVYQAASRDGEPVEVTSLDNDLLAILERPNPTQTAAEFWITTITFLELAGNALWLKVRDGLGVRELWNLPVNRFEPVVESTPQGPVHRGYRIIGTAVVIPREDVVHLMYPNPCNRFWGLGTLQNAAGAVRSLNKMKLSQLSAFNNQILTDLVFSTDQTLGQSSFDRMMAILMDRYGGPEKTNVPLLLENNLKVEHLRRPPAEMDYPKSLNLSRDEILAVFGVHPIIAGIVENANRSNSDTQRRSFLSDTISPRLRLIEQKITAELCFEFGDDVWVQFDDCVPEDAEAAAKRDQSDVAAGIIAPNEVRQKQGREPAPWGEYPRWVYEFRAEHGHLPWEQPPSPPEVGRANFPQGRGVRGHVSGRGMSKAQRKAAIRRVAADYKGLERASIKTLRRYFSQQAARIKGNLRRLFPDLPQSDPAGRSLDVRRRELSTLIIPDLRARLYADGTLAGFRTLGGVARFNSHPVDLHGCLHGGRCRAANLTVRNLPDDVESNLDDWERAAEELAKRMLSKLRSALAAGGEMQIDLAGLSGRFDLDNPLATAFMRSRGHEYWRDTVGATTRERLSEAMADVLADGPTIDRLAEVVEEIMGDRIRSSAVTIARTEATTAYNFAGHLVREKYELSQSEWMATLDSRTRSGHTAADGQIRDRGIPFDVGGEKLLYPGDPAASLWNRVSCRCVATGIPSEDDEIAPGFEEDA